MYSSEKAFMMSFIACLSQRDIKTIKLNDYQYAKGVESMCQYFRENRERLGGFSSELAMLFLKNSNGEYRQFTTAIHGLNADMLSFDNPFYFNANITIDRNDAGEILEENSEYISIEHIDGFVTAFCESIN